MRYYKRESVPWDGDTFYFREDETFEAIDNLDDSFFPVKISIITKEEYVIKENIDEV